MEKFRVAVSRGTGLQCRSPWDLNIARDRCLGTLLPSDNNNCVRVCIYICIMCIRLYLRYIIRLFVRNLLEKKKNYNFMFVDW